MKGWQKEKAKGFTLVELAIVLVIIGIILGGVLKGQEIIRNAKIKRIVNDYKSYIAAVYTYQDRYGKLPGDTDGDGKIETGEQASLWKDLRAKGIIPGSSTDGTPPTHVFGGKVAIFYMNTFNAHAVCFQNVPSDIIEIIDKQNDDGLVDSGDIRGFTNWYPSTLATSFTDAKHICFSF